MTTCGSCGKTIPASAMKQDEATKKIERALGGSPGAFLFGGLLGEDAARQIPNVMSGSAMRCNRCGVWICGSCAQNSALAAGAGRVQHSGCGGMFENPSD